MKPLDPRLLRYSRSSRGFLISIVVISLCTSVATILQAYLITKLVVAFFQKHQLFSSHSRDIVLLALIFAIRAVLAFINERISALSSIRIRGELRNTVVRKTLANNGIDSQEIGTSGLAILVTKGIGNLDSYFSKFIPQLFIAAIVPIMVGVTIAFQDLCSGLIVLITVPLIPIFGILIGKFTAAATSKKWQTLNLLSGYFLDLISGLSTLRVYGRHKLQGDRLKKVGDDYRKETMKVLRISFLSSLALELVATLSVALLAVTIGLRLVSGSISLETGLFVLIIAPEVYWPIRQVASFFHTAAEGLEAINSVFTILEKSEPSGSTKINQILAITWSQLIVSYPNRTELHIPSGQINAGEIQALIGASGSGKSTLALILLRFIKPTSGEVLVSTDQGSIPLEDIEITNWRAKLSWLPQEPKFPVGTVAQVLRHAKPEASEFELVEVLNKVDLDIAQLQNGLRTELGSIRQPLSLGQQRKIALARALLKSSQILILDEPTASVDDVSETTIKKFILEASDRGAGVLLITHRNTFQFENNQITDMARSQ